MRPCLLFTVAPPRASGISAVPRKSIFNIVVFIAIGLALATSARTQTAQQRAWCDIKGGAKPDEVISSCTAVIQFGQETGRNLASAITIRGRAYRAKGELERAKADNIDAARLDPRFGEQTRRGQ